MTLADTLIAAGMTPPKAFIPGRWLRFPGVGKRRSNRSGWCRVISPTLAIYGDWSSSFSALWKDESHRDSAETARQLREAQERERRFAAEQRARQATAARRAQELLDAAVLGPHPYLAAKGFGHLRGLVFGEHLLVPVRDAHTNALISMQQINVAGEKRFLQGGRARGGIYRIGVGGKVYLCEGYATGLSINEAARRLIRNPVVIVCFSAGNLATVAHLYPGAMVCADHDATATGERVARETGLPWVMPQEIGTDFNDLHCRRGLHAVVEMLRDAR
jgi:putative DNA primase/helicase